VPAQAIDVAGAAASSLPAPAGDDGLFGGQAVLVVEQVVAIAVQRNPSIAAMQSAWRAASERYPQVVSLDDPVLMSMIAPASLNSSLVDPAFIVGGSQKLPWFGKRAARGKVAQAEANAAFQDSETTRLEVAETARLAFYDYYLAERELELNAQNLRQMTQFRDTARTRFETNQTTQQDLLQADVALSEVSRRHLELERMQRVAQARLNTLFLRLPETPLPPPPATLPDASALPPAADLRGMAVVSRPDLAAIAARIRAEEAAVAVAAKEFYPDVEVYGRYDSFWQPSATQSPLRAQTGVNVNVPIYRRKRYAALNEASYRVSQRRAEYQQRLSDIHFEVQSGYEQVEQARLAVELYDQKFLPAAERNVSAARSSYDVGRLQFSDLIQAQQQLVTLREKREEALADYHRRRAELERIVAQPLPVVSPPTSRPVNAEEVPASKRTS
jgi:outer membrane protein TolC